MSEITKKALENHAQGLNCCQAVACAFADKVGVDEDTIFKLGEGFGLGMGGMECTCGAVSGAIMVAGMKSSSGDVSKPVTKGQTYKSSKKIVEEFKKKNSSVICKELKGVETKEILRSCAGCIEDAADIAEKILDLG